MYVRMHCYFGFNTLNHRTGYSIINDKIVVTGYAHMIKHHSDY